MISGTPFPKSADSFDAFTFLSDYIIQIKNDEAAFNKLKNALIKEKIRTGFVIPNASTKFMFYIPGRIIRHPANVKNLNSFFTEPSAELIININNIGFSVVSELAAISSYLKSSKPLKNKPFVTARYFEKMPENGIGGKEAQYYLDTVRNIQDAFILRSTFEVEPMLESSDIPSINHLIRGVSGRPSMSLPPAFWIFVVSEINKYYALKNSLIPQKELIFSVNQNKFKYPGSNIEIGENLKRDNAVKIWKEYKSVFN